MSNHESKGSHPWNRDAALERAWREASAEQPPSHVDAAIIAAAHQSVQDRNERPNMVPARIRSRTWLTQWQPLAAAAVVATLAFGLVQMLPREHELAPPMQWKESAPVPASTEPHPESRPRSESQPEPLSSSAREATNDRQPAGAQRAVGVHERVGVPGRAPAQYAVPAPPAAPAAAAATAESTANDTVPEINASDTASKAETADSHTAPTADNTAVLGEISADRRKALESTAAGRATTTAAAAQSPSPRGSEGNRGNATPLDSPAWAAKVAALHASGDVTAAEHALRKFRMVVADADTYLPDSLRSWARTVE